MKQGILRFCQVVFIIGNPFSGVGALKTAPDHVPRCEDAREWGDVKHGASALRRLLVVAVTRSKSESSLTLPSPFFPH